MECFFEEFVAYDHVAVEGRDWSLVGAPSRCVCVGTICLKVQ